MKVLFFVLALVAAVSAQQLAPPTTCEQVLTQQQCDFLKNLVKVFGETTSDLNEAIKEAVAKHISNAKDLMNFIEEFLVQHAKNFKCESVLSADQCDQLMKLGGLLKLRVDEVNLAIKEAIAHGASKATEIYQKALEYARDVLSNASCEDMLDADLCKRLMDFAKMAHLKTSEVVKAVREAIIEHGKTAADIYAKAVAFLTGEIACEGILGADICSKLKNAAQMLGEKVDVINAAIREAVTKHFTKVSDILNFVQEKMVDLATDFKCEKVLPANMCANIDKIGGHFKDSLDIINKAIKEAIVHGATGVQEIYNVAIAWLRDHVIVSKCEDLIAAATCQKIRDFAKKVHVNVKDVMQAVKEAIADGAWGPVEIYKKAVEYIKSKISCEAVMGQDLCDKIRKIADRFSISLTKVDQVLREAIANGVTKVSDLYKAVIKYIMDRWTDLIGDEELLAIGEQSDVLPDLRAALERVVNKVLDDLKVANENVRRMIKKVIMEGKVRIAEIKQKIKEMLAKIGNASDEEISYSKRSVVDDLKAALEKAKGYTKDLIQNLLKMSKAKLEEAKAMIKQLLENFGLKQDSFIDVLLDTTHDQILADLETETSALSDTIVADMINEADQL